VVWPRFVAFPIATSASRFVERVGLLPLVGGGIFLVFSGVANIAQWYPWRFSFTASHYSMAWVTIGALVAHVGAKWVTTRRSLARPSGVPGWPTPTLHSGRRRNRRPATASLAEVS